MDGKEPQVSAADAKASESVEISELIKAVNDEKKEVKYDVEKFQNNEDIKKIKRKGKKLQKDIATILESKVDTRDKITEIFSKFQKIVNETRASHERYHQAHKIYLRNTQERDSVINEHGKAQNVTGRLESLCKDLQKQNADLVEENKKLQSDESGLRSKLAAEFQNRITTISTQLEEHSREHHIKTKENEIIKEKLLEVDEKYGKREEIFTQEYNNRENKFEDNYLGIKDKFKEIEDEANKIEEYNEQLNTAKAEAKVVQDKLSLLTDKSDNFHKTMTQANNFFSQIKQEMENISKKNKKLDSANAELQKKSERSNISLYERIEENLKLQKEIEKLDGQKEGLQKLLETLKKNLKEKDDRIQELQGAA